MTLEHECNEIIWSDSEVRSLKSWNMKECKKEKNMENLRKQKEKDVQKTDSGKTERSTVIYHIFVTMAVQSTKCLKSKTILLS